MAIRESLLNTITSVADSDFVRLVTSAGESSKATLQNVIKSFETGLGAKSSLTTSDYIRVVGSDNNLYKQSVSDVKSTMGIDTLSSNLTSLSNALGQFARYSNDFSSTSPGKLDDIVSLPSGVAGRFLVMFYYNGYIFAESFSMYFIQRGATKGDFYGLTTIKKGSETRTVSLSTNGTVTKGDTNSYNVRCVVLRLSA